MILTFCPDILILIWCWHWCDLTLQWHCYAAQQCNFDLHFSCLSWRRFEGNHIIRENPCKIRQQGRDVLHNSFTIDSSNKGQGHTAGLHSNVTIISNQYGNYPEWWWDSQRKRNPSASQIKMMVNIQSDVMLFRFQTLCKLENIFVHRCWL